MGLNGFYIRFSLQRMEGTVSEDFPYETIMEGTTAEEVAEYINWCDSWQKEQADILSEKFDTSKLHGKKIVFVGDSITADRLGYRGIVTKAADMVSSNLAISGAISTDMFRYLPDRLQYFKPEIVSVMIGTNDSLIVAGERNLVRKEEYRDNIAEIIKLSKQSGATVIISTIPPTDESRFPAGNSSNNNANIEEYCEIVREEAEKYGAILNDFSKEAKSKDLGQLMLYDGIHLDKSGQVFFAECWLKTVLEAI